VGLRAHADDGTLEGKVKAVAPCLGRGRNKPAKVRVMGVRPGKDDRLGTARVRDNGRWRFAFPAGATRVYAKYKEHRRLDIGVCREATSKLIRP
jgi:hypothetical protein